MCYWVTTTGCRSPLHGEKSAGNRILTLPIAKAMKVLMFLLAYNLILVIWFQVYDMVILHYYTLQCVHQLIPVIIISHHVNLSQDI